MLLNGSRDARIGATMPAIDSLMKAMTKDYVGVNYEGAIHGFLRAQDDPRIHTGWGILALERDDPGVARQRLQRARELYRQTPPALWFWAATLATAGTDDLDVALAIAREGVERHPHDVVLRNNLAVLLEASGSMAEAEALLRQVLAEEASLPQPFKNLGDLSYRSGRYAEAAANYERAAALAPELGDDLHFKIGNLAFRERDNGGGGGGDA